jgi:class 3 adenylate cyclase
MAGDGVGRLVSINVGLPRDVVWQGRTVHTAVWKEPVDGARMVRRLNVDGDGQGRSGRARRRAAGGVRLPARFLPVVGGIAVHIGARVCSLAAASEVLTTRTVRDLTAGSDLRFSDRGDHALKGVPDPMRIYRVEG